MNYVLNDYQAHILQMNNYAIKQKYSIIFIDSRLRKNKMHDKQQYQSRYST